MTGGLNRPDRGSSSSSRDAARAFNWFFYGTLLLVVGIGMIYAIVAIAEKIRF